MALTGGVPPRSPEGLCRFSRHPIVVPQETVNEVCYIVFPRLCFLGLGRLCTSRAEGTVVEATCRWFGPTQPSRCLRPHVLRSAGATPHPKDSRAEAVEFGRLKGNSRKYGCTKSRAPHEHGRHGQNPILTRITLASPRRNDMQFAPCTSRIRGKRFQRSERDYTRLTVCSALRNQRVAVVVRQSGGPAAVRLPTSSETARAFFE
jgi:hypothetical protein